MIRPLKETDKEAYLRMTAAFYQSDAVLSPIQKENMERTFSLLMEGSPFAEGYALEQYGVMQGYALLAITWSQEAGGKTVWLEEFYVTEAARGKGLGQDFRNGGAALYVYAVAGIYQAYGFGW